jgi:hypothetical protein
LTSCRRTLIEMAMRRDEVCPLSFSIMTHLTRRPKQTTSTCTSLLALVLVANRVVEFSYLGRLISLAVILSSETSADLGC